VTCRGSVFQMRAPATGKALETMEVSRTAGTTGTIRMSSWGLPLLIIKGCWQHLGQGRQTSSALLRQYSQTITHDGVTNDGYNYALLYCSILSTSQEIAQVN